MGLDRISSLPDDLLCRILFFVPPTKHVVATTVLSTRWKNLFASVPHVRLDDSLTQSQTTDVTPFCNFVSKVLCAVISKSGLIRTFRVKCVRGTYDFSVISSWVYFAVIGKLEDLMVHVKSVTNPVALPLQLFHCTTLKRLQLKGKFPFFVPSHVLFPSLEILELSDLVLMDDDSVRRFLQGCTVLEYFYMSDCKIDSISVLEVSVAMLKDLQLLDMDGDYKILLDAPSLESLYCSSYASGGYCGDKLKSIVSATIDVGLTTTHFLDEKVTQLVNMVSNARSLTLDNDTMQSLRSPLPTFPNLTKLWVCVYDARGWLSLPEILEKAPCLEALYFPDGIDDDLGKFMDVASCLPERVPACLSAHLKRVEVCHFRGKEVEYELVEYFLKNGKVLEEMTVTPNHVGDCPMLDVKREIPITKRLYQDDDCPIIDMKSRITNRLLQLPRSLRACQFIVTDGKKEDGVEC